MRKALQIVLGVLAVVPAFYALTGLVLGAGGFGAGDAAAGADNQIRYLSGVYLLVPLLLLRIIPRIEKEGAMLAIVVTVLFIGGVGRLVSLLTVGTPLDTQVVNMVLEMGAPVLLLWQRAVAKAAGEA